MVTSLAFFFIDIQKGFVNIIIIMRNKNALFLVLSLLLIPTFSFASSRTEIIEKTLIQIESSPYNTSNVTSYQNLASDKAVVSDLLPAETPPKLPDVTDKKEGAIESAFYVASGYQMDYMNYRELSGSDTLDRDFGLMQGFYINLGYKSNIYIKEILGRPFIETYFMYFGDSNTYDGRSSLGQALKFKQHASIQRFGMKVGAYTDFGKNGEFFGYFDLGKRIWYRGENRIVAGVLCYAEKYSWMIMGAGVGLTYKLIPKFTLGMEIEFMGGIDAKMRADLYEGGTFKLKGANGIEVKLPLKYSLSKNLSFDLTPYYTYWNIRQSDPVEISGSFYYEPDSTTHQEGLQIGLTYRF